MKVLIGSQNPVKIAATKDAFSKYFGNVEIVEIKVDPEVSPQPIDEETFDGARNRALSLKRLNEERDLGADFFVGIEGGIIKSYSKWFTFSVACVVNQDGKIGIGTSGFVELPKKVVEQILRGKELGKVIDELTGEKNLSQKKGAVGLFTKNIIDRKAFNAHAVVLALAPFLNKSFFQ